MLLLALLACTDAPTDSAVTPGWEFWSAGPALPEARSGAASVVVGNTMYLFGGYGPDGAPTTATCCMISVSV